MTSRREIALLMLELNNASKKYLSEEYAGEDFSPTHSYKVQLLLLIQVQALLDSLDLIHCSSSTAVVAASALE